MSAFELTWFNLKKAWYDNEDFRGDPEDEEAHRRGEDAAHQNWLDTSGHDEEDTMPLTQAREGERVDAPTLDPNHILRLTRPQLDKLIQDAKSEIKRRGAKKADKNVAVVKPTYPSLEHDRITKPKFFSDSVTPNKEGGSLFG